MSRHDTFLVYRVIFIYRVIFRPRQPPQSCCRDRASLASTCNLSWISFSRPVNGALAVKEDAMLASALENAQKVALPK